MSPLTAGMTGAHLTVAPTRLWQCVKRMRRYRGRPEWSCGEGLGRCGGVSSSPGSGITPSPQTREAPQLSSCERTSACIPSFIRKTSNSSPKCGLSLKALRYYVSIIWWRKSGSRLIRLSKLFQARPIITASPPMPTCIRIGPINVRPRKIFRIRTKRGAKVNLSRILTYRIPYSNVRLLNRAGPARDHHHLCRRPFRYD